MQAGVFISTYKALLQCDVGLPWGERRQAVGWGPRLGNILVQNFKECYKSKFKPGLPGLS